MRTNVGLLTTLVTPIPSATPFASCVLPAPSSPVRASTVPARADVPIRRPIARVSSGPLLRIGPATVEGTVDRSMPASIGMRRSVARQWLGGFEVGERHGRRVAVLEADERRATDDARRGGVRAIQDAHQLASLPGMRTP